MKISLYCTHREISDAGYVIRAQLAHNGYIGKVRVAKTDKSKIYTITNYDSVDIEALFQQNRDSGNGLWSTLTCSVIEHDHELAAE